jgi:hypothetical protein
MSLAVGDKFFSFLPHVVDRIGLAVPVDATSMNPGFLTPTGVTRNAGLQAIVDRRVLENGVSQPKHPELRRLRFALVDLTGPKEFSSPHFAGNRETEQGGLGSLSKIACMYAAYQCKFDLEQLARQKGLTTEKDLFDAARDLWNDTQKKDTANVTTLFPQNPKIELFGKLMEIDGKEIVVPRPFSGPDLERMFTVTPGSSGGVDVRIQGSDLILVDPSVPGSPPAESAAVASYLKTGGENLKEVRKLTFAERLYLMIDESDNAAAHSCIESVSFLFLHSAIWQSDFYNPQRGGGLWEASTHDTANNVRWVKPPVPRNNPSADFVSANAAGVAALLTLMAQGELVDNNSSDGMKQLTNKRKAIPGGSHTRSFFLEGFDNHQPRIPVDEFQSKLGIGNFLNDGAIITRTEGSTQIRYVAAGFDAPDSQDGVAFLRRLILELDKCIQENNGLITASTP